MLSGHDVGEKVRLVALRRAREATSVFLASSLLAVLPAASGCNVGPDFVAPKVSVNRGWRDRSDPRLASGGPVDRTWWKSFNDPALDRLVELAYAQNLPLKVAGLRILEARAVLGVAVGEQVPSNVNPIGSASVTKASRATPNAGDFDTTYGEFQVGFDVLWEVDFWGKYRRGVNSAEAAYLATVAEYDDAVVALTAEVARTYVLIRTFQVLVDQARQNVAVQEEGQQIAESRFRNGATSELDVAQATNLLETTRATIPKLLSRQALAENALSTLLGQPVGHLRAVMGSPTGIPGAPARIAVDVPAGLLRRRPDIRAAELRAAAQCERIGIAEADLYPSFVLQGSIGSLTNVGTPSATPLFGLDTLAASTGASLFWPILNYPRILENMRAEDARFQQALILYANTVLVAAQEVEDGISGYLRNQDAVEFEQKAVAAAETAVDLALVQYREGAVDFQRVLDTQRVLLSSQQSLTQTQSDSLTSLISLYKALGGGWEVRLGDPVVDKKTREEMQDRTNWGSHFDEMDEERPESSIAPDPLVDAARK